jgi:hypothetical protein
LREIDEESLGEVILDESTCPIMRDAKNYY